MLNESERRVNAERVRYGIPEEEEQHKYMGLYGQESAPSLADLGAHPTKAQSGLSEAAAAMMRLRNDRDSKIAELSEQKNEIDVRIAEWQGTASEQGDVPMMSGFRASEFRGSWELGAQMEHASRLFEAQKAQLQLRYPILASYSGEDEEPTSDLAQVATGDANEVQAMLQRNIYEKLHNIKSVRDDIDGTSVWKLPRLVQKTRVAQHIKANSTEDSLIKQYEQQVADDAFWEGIGSARCRSGLCCWRRSPKARR